MAIEVLMKYFLLLVVLLTGCSTPRIAGPLMDFKCTILNGHGAYGYMYGTFKSEQAAEEYTEKARLYLVKEQKVPEATSVFCYQVGKE